MRRRREPASNGGFTLLEILVALVVFALAFGVLAQIMQTGLRQSTVARSLAGAAMLARSELARVGIEVPLQVGAVEGESADGLRWQTEIELLADASEDQSLALYQVQVTVAWGESPAEQLVLTTLRTGLPSP
jgi:general secretion pathway protein I